MEWSIDKCVGKGTIESQWNRVVIDNENFLTVRISLTAKVEETTVHPWLSKAITHNAMSVM